MQRLYMIICKASRASVFRPVHWNCGKKSWTKRMQYPRAVALRLPPLPPKQQQQKTQEQQQKHTQNPNNNKQTKQQQQTNKQQTHKKNPQMSKN